MSHVTPISSAATATAAGTTTLIGFVSALTTRPRRRSVRVTSWRSLAISGPSSRDEKAFVVKDFSSLVADRPSEEARDRAVDGLDLLGVPGVLLAARRRGDLREHVLVGPGAVGDRVHADRHALAGGLALERRDELVGARLALVVLAVGEDDH